MQRFSHYFFSLFSHILSFSSPFLHLTFFFSMLHQQKCRKVCLCLWLYPSVFMTMAWETKVSIWTHCTCVLWHVYLTWLQTLATMLFVSSLDRDSRRNACRESVCNKCAKCPSTDLIVLHSYTSVLFWRNSTCWILIFFLKFFFFFFANISFFLL